MPCVSFSCNFMPCSGYSALHGVNLNQKRKILIMMSYILLNHGLVKNTRISMSWKQNKTKILNLCIGWHILRSYRFLADVTFNKSYKISTQKTFFFFSSSSFFFKENFFLLFSVIDSFKWFWMESCNKNIQLYSFPTIY